MVGEENNSRMECVVVELVIDSTKFLGNAKTSYFPELFLLNNNFISLDKTVSLVCKIPSICHLNFFHLKFHFNPKENEKISRNKFSINV